ncbi:hypothetical protein C4D60_Mb06t05950 [Musa balbisiana]|uniref:RanBP2-type domain-containing protein n=1 Tax=Musa balbisiana TaxID=52838 RepID=A0A4V6T432_MUSBA|nr:hypothetical protein C4D60_Mb06t05950 [Musa balbisiana]
MSKWPGDWNCWSCHHHNFSWRDACQKCGNLRSSVGDLSDSTGSGCGGSSLGFTASGHVRLGDWYCSCGGHNFASRSSCHSCGTVKHDSTIGGSDSNDMPGSQGRAAISTTSLAGRNVIAARHLRDPVNDPHRVEKMSRRAGDWNCSLCQHHNFSRRDSCQQCGHPRLCSGDFSDYAGLGGGRGGSSFGVVSDVRPGDWYCSCGGHNFASRSSCHSCCAFRDESAVGVIGGFDNSEMAGSQGITYGGGGWKSGDWLCTRSGCNHHNFASRRECYRCKAPKGCGA